MVAVQVALHQPERVPRELHHEHLVSVVDSVPST
jgi:hypothetical protein